MSLLESVQSVFREVFDDPGLMITEETNASHVEGWDSYNQINLILALEDRFKMTFTTEEFSGAKCVGDFLAILTRKGVPA